MNLYFVRHGETEQNVKKSYYGSMDVSLNKKGEEQSSKAGIYLQNVDFNVVYCSERSRARETAEIILGNRKNTIVFDGRINEMNFGIFEGKTYEEIKALYPEEEKEWKSNWKEFCPSEGESYVMFYKRVKSFIEEVRELNIDNLLIVTHGGVIRTVYSYILNENLDFYWKFASKNGDITLIKYKYGDFFIDSITHIDEVGK